MNDWSPSVSWNIHQFDEASIDIDDIFRKLLSRWLIHIDPIFVVVHDTIPISKEIRAMKTLSTWFMNYIALAIWIKSDGYFVTNWWVITWALIRGGKLRGRVNSTLVTCIKSKQSPRISNCPAVVPTVAGCYECHVRWRSLCHECSHAGAWVSLRGSSHDGHTPQYCTVHTVQFTHTGHRCRGEAGGRPTPDATKPGTLPRPPAPPPRSGAPLQ